MTDIHSLSILQVQSFTWLVQGGMVWGHLMLACSCHVLEPLNSFDLKLVHVSVEIFENYLIQWLPNCDLWPPSGLQPDFRWVAYSLCLAVISLLQPSSLCVLADKSCHSSMRTWGNKVAGWRLPSRSIVTSWHSLTSIFLLQDCPSQPILINGFRHVSLCWIMTHTSMEKLTTLMNAYDTHAEFITSNQFFTIK